MQSSDIADVRFDNFDTIKRGNRKNIVKHTAINIGSRPIPEQWSGAMLPSP